MKTKIASNVLPLLTALLIVFALSITTNAQNTSEKGIMYFSAEIENPNSDSLVIRENSGNREIVKTFYLKDGKLEKDTVILKMGNYRIGDGTEGTNCFLKPDFDLHLILNTEEFDETVEYTGIGANENNYLAESTLLNESLGYVNYYGYYAKKDEKEFVDLRDSIYNVELELFDNYKGLFDSDFAKYEYEKLRIYYLDKFDNYPWMHRHLTENPDFKVSENFPDPFENFDVNNEEMLYLSSYSGFVSSYIEHKRDEMIKKDTSLKYHNTFVDLIDTEIENVKVKEELAYIFGKYSFVYVSYEELEYCYSKTLSYIDNDDYRQVVTDKYELLLKTASGAPSPTFELNDIDSNLVKLEDYRGKLVYIDIWATWCKPCMEELPHLDTLQHHFAGQDIVFIGICENDSKKSWENVVRKIKMPGVQLFISERNHPFTSAYFVSYVPRYILIDREGNIIDSKAKRPSNSELKPQIEELLKEE